MSGRTREPMWYCHEVPDPHCASCNGTFVEKIEDPADDPRQFGLADGGHWGNGPLPGDMDTFLSGLRSILGGGAPVPPMAPTPPPAPVPPYNNNSSNSNDASHTTTTTTRNLGRNGQFTIRIERSSTSGGRTRTVVTGGPQPGGGGNADTAGEVPRLSQFVPRNADGSPQERANITGPLLTQYLLALMGNGLGGNRNGDPFAELFGGMFGPGGMPPGGGENGRWGDYVFNQEALDQIISQIMENNNAHQPVPATEQVVEKLPREVLEEGSPLLEKDCAVCKDQFKLETEDPDEQIVITLPCQHPFHEPCILPWLKTSGTCPKSWDNIHINCRYQLVPQPDSHAPGPGPPSAGSSRSNSSSTGDNNGGGGILQNMINLFAQAGQAQNQQGSGGNSGSSSGQRQNSTPSTSSSQSSSTHPRAHDDFDIPGGWGDDLD
ncbi:uncharacterized protein BXZ73DRAFT_91960 [Epithele typhae]|uniref:uncharacterized protein n=1 Tax=Epithele typhae TaxID=378194 RepID=UPI0020075BAB|nr:uncharacterized protein BXZ73DRAFT_91960 [Epithele typhae]KAH9920226.1 hypothetical protein BXZ73DRAFT_91960 [Epithele typhae]